MEIIIFLLIVVTLILVAVVGFLCIDLATQKKQLDDLREFIPKTYQRKLINVGERLESPVPALFPFHYRSSAEIEEVINALMDHAKINIETVHSTERSIKMVKRKPVTRRRVR